MTYEVAERIAREVIGDPKAEMVLGPSDSRITVSCRINGIASLVRVPMMFFLLDGMSEREFRDEFVTSWDQVMEFFNRTMPENAVQDGLIFAYPNVAEVSR